MQKKIVLICPKLPQKTLEETLDERSRNARDVGQRSVSMYSTNIDSGVANSQRVGEGGLAQAWARLPCVPKGKK